MCALLTQCLCLCLYVDRFVVGMQSSYAFVTLNTHTQKHTKNPRTLNVTSGQKNQFTFQLETLKSASLHFVCHFRKTCFGNVFTFDLCVCVCVCYEGFFVSYFSLTKTNQNFTSFH